MVNTLTIIVIIELLAGVAVGRVMAIWLADRVSVKPESRQATLITFAPRETPVGSSATRQGPRALPLNDRPARSRQGSFAVNY